MQLLILRHADAGDWSEWEQTGRPDEERPLSKKGVEQMTAGMKGLLTLVPKVDLVVTSPYTRALQTAGIVLDGYGAKARQETSRTLEPNESPETFLEWLRERDHTDVLVAVGHEPHLGLLVTWLISGDETSRVEMKKAGACLLDIQKKPGKSSAILQWLMGPKQLARLGA